MHPGREARAPPSSPAPRHLRPKRVRADGLARSTFYDPSPVPLGGDELVARIGAICDEFECYGYRRRRGGAAPPGRGGEQQEAAPPHARARPAAEAAPTLRDHDGQRPRRADLSRPGQGSIVPDRPNQLWVADLTYVAIPGGFVYLAAILDAWSRKVVGYAISRSMDARIAVAALKAAIRTRAPPQGCIHHSDRGSQYASEAYRDLLAMHGLTGSMSRRGNPYDCEFTVLLGEPDPALRLTSCHCVDVSAPRAAPAGLRNVAS